MDYPTQTHTQVKKLVFTSDGKRKDQINLRNLLSDLP